jgi:hypothetical protein
MLLTVGFISLGTTSYAACDETLVFGHLDEDGIVHCCEGEWNINCCQTGDCVDNPPKTIGG